MPNAPEHKASFTASQIISATGYCSSCSAIHTIPLEGALTSCRELMQYLQQTHSIGMRTEQAADPRLSTDYLFGSARGKMFGVLQCKDFSGKITYLRAFSGQYNGLWHVDGWSPPLFDLDEFNRINTPQEKIIKELSTSITNAVPHSDTWFALRKKRKTLSRELMIKLHGIYQLSNAHNEQTTLSEAYSGCNGIPTGVGDCCGPKLLNDAYTQKLTPLSLAEFYWGKENKSQTKKHGYFYPSCRDKCQPILGFMLCGLKSNNENR